MVLLLHKGPAFPLDPLPHTHSLMESQFLNGRVLVFLTCLQEPENDDNDDDDELLLLFWRHVCREGTFPFLIYPISSRTFQGLNGEKLDVLICSAGTEVQVVLMFHVSWRSLLP